MKKYKRKFKLKKLSTYWILFILVAIMVSLSIGYSYWNTDLKIISNVSLDEIKIYYFELPYDWSGTQVYCYMWGNTSSGTLIENGGWKEVLMEKVEGTSNIYSYTVYKTDAHYNYTDNLIFYTENSDINRTIDISISDENNGQIFKIENYESTDGTIRVFFMANANYYDGSNWVDYVSDYKYSYVWNYSNSSINNSWPGEKMTKVSDKVYQFIVDTTKYNRIIFNYGSGNYQTSDLTVPSESDLLYNAYDKVWYDNYYSGNWYSYDY